MTTRINFSNAIAPERPITQAYTTARQWYKEVVVPGTYRMVVMMGRKKTQFKTTTMGATNAAKSSESFLSKKGIITRFATMKLVIHFKIATRAVSVGEKGILQAVM